MSKNEIIETINSELKEIARLNQELKRYLKETDVINPKKLYIYSFALIVHSFYSGVENVFKRIALEIDKKLPMSKNWHKDLLNKMAKDNYPIRQKVISQELAQDLQKYLAFRHLMRNMYVFKLDWLQFKPLVLGFANIVKRFNKEITDFLFIYYENK